MHSYDWVKLGRKPLAGKGSRGCVGVLGWIV